jgi:hypothetical protein
MCQPNNVFPAIGEKEQELLVSNVQGVFTTAGTMIVPPQSAIAGSNATPDESRTIAPVAHGAEYIWRSVVAQTPFPR